MANIFIGIGIGVFVYGSILYWLYMEGAIHMINKKERFILWLLIGVGYVWFIPHIIVAFVYYKIIKPIIKRIKK